MAATPFFSNLKRFLVDGRFSDITIVCVDKEFKVHRMVLEGSSPVFENRGGENATPEAHVTLELNDDPEAMQALIHFLYYFVYNDAFVKHTPLMCFAVKVYAIADKYELPSLQKLAASKLKSICKPTDNVDAFISTIHLINDTTDPSDGTLWEIVVPAIKDNVTYLLGFAQFRTLVFQMEGLTLQLLSMLGDSKADVSSLVANRFLPFKLANTEAEDTDGGDESDEGTTGMGYMYGRGRKLGGG